MTNMYLITDHQRTRSKTDRHAGGIKNSAVLVGDSDATLSDGQNRQTEVSKEAEDLGHSVSQA